MEVIILWLVLSLSVGSWYGNKGGSGVLGFLVSIIFTPLVGAIMVVVSNPGPKCPHCRETVKRGATLCRFCGQSLQAVRV